MNPILCCLTNLLQPDPEMINEVLDVMTDLANLGTMIVVTHEMVAKKLASKVIFMDNGIIVRIIPDNFLIIPKKKELNFFKTDIETLMEINNLNVTELRNGLLKGEFSPKEILDSTINKIQEIDNKINAFLYNALKKLMNKLKNFLVLRI